jgi:DNA-binding MarR family transcriptional regulator
MNSSSADTPAQVWSLMQSFVEANSARTKLREQLGTALGSGRGKIKALLLLEKEPLTLAEIADALQVDRPYTTVIVNRLESFDLVERTIDARDRRRKLVALTSSGREVVNTARRVLDTPPVGLTRLSRAELRQLATSLSKLSSSDDASR